MTVLVTHDRSQPAAVDRIVEVVDGRLREPARSGPVLRSEGDLVRALFNAAAVYTLLGLVSGLYYRELTKANGFTGDTQLAVVHTHLLVLGTVVFLLVLTLERLFNLSATRLFGPFLWTYHVGLLLTVTMLTVTGTRQVLGGESNAMLAGLAGLGHLLLTAALLLFFLALGLSLPARERDEGRQGGRELAAQFAD